MSRPNRSMVTAITKHPDSAPERLRTLRLIVAERLDATESARETASLARVLLDVENALRALKSGPVQGTPVDDLLARRAARGAQ